MGEAQFGVRHLIGAPIANTRLADQCVVSVPPRSAKFRLSEWKLSNEMRCKNTVDQQQLADRILAESQKVRDEVNERAQILKDVTNWRIEERIGDVDYYKKEHEVQRKYICEELEVLGVSKMRLQDCLASLQTPLAICRKCVTLRENRIGIELVEDDVENALQQEITAIIGGQSILNRALEQLNDQMRRLRSARYHLDRDLKDKQRAIAIDKESLFLKNTDLCLSLYEGYTNLDPAIISTGEYDLYSTNNTKQAAREVNNARSIGTSIDTLLKQVINDLWEAHNSCNLKFNERIESTKLAKTKLDDMHKDTNLKIYKMQDNILQFQKALSKKESSTALSHTRLGKRAQRPGAELVKDAPGQALYYECEMLRQSTKQLQQMLQESNASLRYLNLTLIQLEEDINVKLNTLKIDEVDCMTLRATMDYHAY